MKSPKTNKTIWLSTAVGFALLLLNVSPQMALAQQWTTNGNHISNANSGNVGIGISNPAAKLDVLSTGTARMIAGDGCWNLGVFGGIGLGISAFSGCTNYTILGDGTHSYFNAPSGHLFFRVGNVSKMTIHSSGNVGIGIENPAYPLTVKKDIIGDAQLRLNSNNVSLYLGAQWLYGLPAIGTNDATPLQFVTNNTVRALFDSSGLFDIRESNAGLQSQLRLYHMNGDAGVNPGSTEIEFLHGGNQLATSKMRFVRTFNGTGSSNTDFYLDLVKGNAGNNGNTTNTLLFAQGLTGNLGIGTTAPAFKLDVAGSINATSVNLNGAPITSSQWATSGATINYGAGNVGIGTTAPAAKLHIVSGNDNPNNLLSLDTGVHGGSQFQIGGTTNNESYFNLNVYRAGLYFTRLSVSNYGHLLLQPSGDSNVGIGTSGPNYKLDVQGGQVNASGGLCIAGDCKTAWPQAGGSSPWSTSGSNVYYNGGNVGIGTASPGASLDIGGNPASAFRTAYLNISGSNGSATDRPFIRGTNTHLVINGYGTNSGGTLYLNYPGDLTSGQTTSTRIQETLYVSATNSNGGGNVGIGTTTPTTKLHVVGDGKVTGNLTVDGNIAAKYQDVAEWVPASEHIPAGTVVVLDSTKSNQVISSTQAYDTRVAGVISEKPGIALGESADNKVLVATTGRVRVKVDATRSPIHIGDLLVTSDKEGVAMKSEPVNIGGVQIHRPGTLVGKALEPLAKGEGTILVLLSLQ